LLFNFNLIFLLSFLLTATPPPTPLSQSIELRRSTIAALLAKEQQEKKQLSTSTHAAEMAKLDKPSTHQTLNDDRFMKELSGFLEELESESRGEYQLNK